MKLLAAACAVVLVTGCATASPTVTPAPQTATSTAAASPQSPSASATTPEPAATPSSTASAAFKLPTGQDLCYLLTAADFTAAGVTGAGALTANEYDTEFYCVWAGKSSATGGIEMDAFIVDSPADRDESFDSVDSGPSAEDVTAQVAGAQRAHIGTTSSDGPEFAEIAVQSGNFIFGIGMPPVRDWHGQLISLANLVVTRAAAVAAGATALPAASPTD